MSAIETYFKGDRTIWLIVILLSILSTLAVYSSTGTLAYKYQSGNTEYYLFKHAGILLFGFVIMYVGHRIKYTHYSRWATVSFIIVVPLLLLTLFMGTNLNDANRWLTLPIINTSFQTSDFAKVALILYIAKVLSKKQDNIKDFKSAFLPVMLPVLIVCACILPANFSTAAVLFATSCVIMFIGRINLKYIVAMIGVGVVAFGIFIGIAYLVGYNGRIKTWESRIENFSKGEADGNYQVQQAKIAIAKGGLIGKGPGNSTQKNFLPHPYSDFIFAIIIDLLLFYRALQIMKRTERAFAALITVGCAFSLTFQALINMAVAVNLFPVTGQPLPMLSMGGTSIWFTSIALGIILSVSGEIDNEETEEEKNLALAV
jgi:cell division protein FtsW